MIDSCLKIFFWFRNSEFLFQIVSFLHHFIYLFNLDIDFILFKNFVIVLFVFHSFNWMHNQQNLIVHRTKFNQKQSFPFNFLSFSFSIHFSALFHSPLFHKQNIIINKCVLYPFNDNTSMTHSNKKCTRMSSLESFSMCLNKLKTFANFFINSFENLVVKMFTNRADTT